MQVFNPRFLLIILHMQHTHSKMPPIPFPIVGQNIEGRAKQELRGTKVIERAVQKIDLEKYSSIKEDLAFWLGKRPQERIAAIEFLRRQYHGSSARLQRSARVIQQARG
jgi:hypothetical protein